MKFCAPRIEVHAALPHRLLQDLGIREQEVRRRHNVEQLPDRERDNVLVLPRHAAHVGRRIVPPLLLQQEALVDQIVRPALPGFADEAPVLRQRLDAAGIATPFEQALAGVTCEPHCFLRGFFEKLHPLAGRRCEMRSPIGVGFGQRRRRQPGCEARRGCMQ